MVAKNSTENQEIQVDSLFEIHECHDVEKLETKKLPYMLYPGEKILRVMKNRSVGMIAQTTYIRTLRCILYKTRINITSVQCGKHIDQTHYHQQNLCATDHEDHQMDMVSEQLINLLKVRRRRSPGCGKSGLPDGEKAVNMATS